MPLTCKIISQDRPVFTGPVDMVMAPGTEGLLGILPHHQPVLTTLKLGEVLVRQGGREEVFAISGGVMEVLPDSVIILADAAERAEEIDLARADAARRRVEEALHSVPLNSEAHLSAEAALQRSLLRLQVGRRRKVTGGR